MLRFSMLYVWFRGWLQVPTQLLALLQFLVTGEGYGKVAAHPLRQARLSHLWKEIVARASRGGPMP